MGKITEEKKKEICDVVNAIKRINNHCDALSKITGVNCDSPFYNEIFKLVDMYLANLSQSLCDDDEILSWFCYENDFGKTGASLFDDYSNQYVIKTLDDVFAYIEETTK